MMTAYENEMIEVLPKLVRNNIAQHLLTEGIAEEVEVHSTNDEETYRAMLKSKLMEEATKSSERTLAPVCRKRSVIFWKSSTH